MTAAALPSVEPDVVMISSRGKKGGVAAKTLRELETKHAGIKRQGAVKVGHLEMHVTV